MKYYKKLIGERIYLSPRNTEEVEKFTKWLNDFETTDYIGRRKCKFINGKYYDSIEMDILAEEFKGSYINNKEI